MAQPALDWFRKRGLLLKAEVTEGTDSVPVAGTDGLLVQNGKCGTEFDKVERNIDRSFFTSNPFAVANKRSYIEGDIELWSPAVPGTNSAHVKPLLLIAGMTEVLTVGTKTTRYNPISSAIGSASAYFYHVDEFIKALGARANINSLRMEIGKIFMMNFRVQGTYTTVTTASVPAITLPTTVPQVSTYANSTLTFNAGADVTMWGKHLEVNFNNELQSKEYTSVLKHQISNRQATWSARVARADLADFNPWTIRDAGTIMTAKWKKSGELGTCTAELGIRGQIETIEMVEIDGDLGWDLSGPCVASNSGGDEFYIEFDDT